MSLTRTVAIGAFVAGWLALAALELLARREGSRLPTVGQLCGYVMRYRAGIVPVGRIGVYAVWCWLGWHLFAR
ncbi:hypothetical protein GCM10023322_17310 [Rugosimonospora acidiphila]|uniref:Uncharacterized protein n=1 Tax=Rugosimonospora acidiphila TaxID=556531 RepID=A0ABP9RPJ6_9ACTN